MDVHLDVGAIAQRLRTIPKIWDGKTAILEMKQSGYRQWKQMEWPGFYFQFLCDRHLSNLMQIPGPRYGNVTFDAFMTIPWDFKAHASNAGTILILNDSEAIADAIGDHGAFGAIMACGDAHYNDASRDFQKWHEDLKGGKSQYEIERLARGAPSRRRKVAFELQEMAFVRLTDKSLVKCGAFQEGFRNADGSARRSKVKLDLRTLTPDERVHSIRF